MILGAAMTRRRTDHTRSNTVQHTAQTAVEQTERGTRNAKTKTRTGYALCCKFCHKISPQILLFRFRCAPYPDVLIITQNETICH
jgi:hypothetical protein